MKIVKQMKLPLILLGVLLMQACTNKSGLLIKSWRIEDLKYSEELSPDLRANVDNWIKEMKSSFKLTYNADGTYTTVLNDHTMKGTWKMNWNATKITSTGADGAPKEFKILELTDSKYAFETEEGKSKVTFVMIPAS
jgi:hypothetical protein